MWEKQKSYNYGTELVQEIKLSGNKVLDVAIRYRSGYRYEEKAPYMIRMDFIVSDCYMSCGVPMKRTVLDFSNMPKDVAMTGYDYEKRTIGPLNKVAAKYDTPEKVLALFYKVNPGYVPPEVEIPEIPAAIPAAV